MLYRFMLILAACALGAGAGVAAAAPPALEVLGPTENAVVVGDAVTVAFRVGDFRIVPSTIPVSEFGQRPDANLPGEGHLHLMLDLEPLVVWDRDEPYTFTNVPTGAHRLTVELANNDHSSLSPPVVREIRFQTVPQAPRAGLGGGQRAVQPGAALATVLLGLLAAAIALRRRERAAR
jgi:hypothetical protein